MKLLIRHELRQPFRFEFVELLSQNVDIFLWIHKDIEEINPKIAFHKLNIVLSTWPKLQRWRPINAERYETLQNEVEKLLSSGFIKEAIYPKLVVNLILVKKNNRDWRVSIDFTDLNKDCHKDNFPFPRIDQMVDIIARHEILTS